MWRVSGIGISSVISSWRTIMAKNNNNQHGSSGKQQRQRGINGVYH